MSAKSVRFAADAGNGPDIVDVSNFLRNLEKTHDIVCHFEVRTGNGHYVGCAQVTIVITTKVLNGPGKFVHERISEAFPGHKHKTLTAVMYFLCHKADYWASNTLYKQTSF